MIEKAQMKDTIEDRWHIDTLTETQLWILTKGKKCSREELMLRIELRKELYEIEHYHKGTAVSILARDKYWEKIIERLKDETTTK